MNVLSLCDGISAGRVALDRAGVKYTEYCASEIDPNAIKIAQHNYPDTVQIGDMTKIYTSIGTDFVYGEKLDFDIHGDDLLLLSGTPCQRLSHIGCGLGLEDEKDNLFYTFVHIKNNLLPKYFLFENTPTTKENIIIISTLLGVHPVVINSDLVSAQNRKRYYWTNIKFDIPKDRNIKLQDILLHGNAHRFKSKTVRVGGRCSKDRHEWDIADTTGRTYDIVECERLQTFDDNYTKASGVSMTNRFKAIGNSWTVDVIAHIFKGLK